MSKQLLKSRISIVMIRLEYTFLNSLIDFQSQLKKLFAFEYTLDEIEDTLHQMEEDFITQHFIEQEESNIPEIPEDYNY